MPASDPLVDHGSVDGPPGMVWIAPGEFTMGSGASDANPDERPPHRVRVDGFWMDRSEVTNGQFRAFVEATNHLTTAERLPDLDEIMANLPSGASPPDSEKLVPASIVFNAPAQRVARDEFIEWWELKAGANWRHPHGPDSMIEGLDNHPVVHVLWFDAVAYSEWCGKRLPTEAEWEYAARGGLETQPYVWGNQRPTARHANLWQGTFPYRNLVEDGFAETALVRSFAPNGYGLSNMAGNVWEWCSDWYRHDTYARRAEPGPIASPTGPRDSFDPQEPAASKRVLRGGSFLCNATYCAGYRPSTQMKTTPDTSLSHSGFRCVMTPDQWKTVQTRNKAQP